MTPRRYQQERKKGWRKPANTVSVARPWKWGNPFRVQHEDGDWTVRLRGVYMPSFPTRAGAQAKAVSWFLYWVEHTDEGRALAEAARRELRGKNVCCWCALDDPCHGDVLLKIANEPKVKP